jgi:Zn-dependent peptidase ImmA (M78 family)
MTAAKTVASKHPKMPTQIKIGTQDWTIIQRSSNVDDSLSSSAYGYTLDRSSTIVIDMDATPSRKRQILLHELLHAIRYSMGNPITPSSSDDESKTTEAWEHYFIGIYEEGLLLTIRNNPDLLEYLLSEE